MAITRSTTVTIAAASDTSGAVQINESDSALVLVPAAFTGTHMSFQVSTSLTGDFYTVYDETGAAEDVKLVTNTWVQIPSTVMTGHSLKLVAASTQSTARTLTVLTKSDPPQS